MRRSLGGLVFAVLLIGVRYCTAAQSKDSEFEVASIKVAPPPDSRGLTVHGRVGGPGTTDPTRIQYLNLSLRELLLFAYDVRFLECKESIDEPNFNVEARLPLGSTAADAVAMLRSLLKERFHLSARVEKRSKSVYALRVAKGPVQFSAKPVAGDPAPISGNTPTARDAVMPQAPVLDRDGFPLPRADGKPGFQSEKGKARLVLKAATFERLCNVLTVYAGDTVVNATELEGQYDFSFFFVSRSPDGEGPNIFEALPRQLGLALARANMPVDVLVVDHVSKLPDSN